VWESLVVVCSLLKAKTKKKAYSPPSRSLYRLTTRSTQGATQLTQSNTVSEREREREITSRDICESLLLAFSFSFSLFRVGFVVVVVFVSVSIALLNISTLFI